MIKYVEEMERLTHLETVEEIMDFRAKVIKEKTSPITTALLSASDLKLYQLGVQKDNLKAMIIAEFADVDTLITLGEIAVRKCNTDVVAMVSLRLKQLGVTK